MWSFFFRMAAFGSISFQKSIIFVFDKDVVSFLKMPFWLLFSGQFLYLPVLGCIIVEMPRSSQPAPEQFSVFKLLIKNATSFSFRP